MHKALLTDVQAHVRHLPLDTEEQHVAGAQLMAVDGFCDGPELSRRTWNAVACSRI